MRRAIGVAIGALSLLACTNQPTAQGRSELGQAEQLLRTCQYDPSERLLREFLPHASGADAALAQVFLADLSWRRGELAGASELLRQSIASGQLGAASELNAEESLGKALVLQRRYGEAVVEFKRALAIAIASGKRHSILYPRRETYAIFAAALAERGDVADALATIDAATKLDAQSAALRPLKAALEQAAQPGPGQYVKLVFGDDLSITPTNMHTEVAAIRRVSPLYPREAAMDHVEGKVVVEFDVAESGAVSDVRIVESTPPDVFDAATLRAARQWTFQPATKDCHPVAEKVVQPINFRLELD